MAENREIVRGPESEINQRFAQLFGDSDGHFTFTGANVRDAIGRLRINGQSYAERYEIGEITDNNYQAVVHHVMDNITNGDIAKSYWNSQPDQVMQILLMGKDPADPLVTSLQPPSPMGVGRPESLSLWKQVMGIFGFYKEEREAYQRQMEDYNKAQMSLRIYNENAFQAAQEARAVEGRVREVCAVDPARKERVREAFATQEKRTALREAARTVEGLQIPAAEAAAERIRRYIPDYRPAMRSGLGLPGFDDPNTVLDMLQAYESSELTAEQLQGVTEEQRREIGQRFAQVFKLAEAPAVQAGEQNQAQERAAQPPVTDEEKDAAAAAVARIYTRFSEGRVPQLDAADPESIRANGSRIVQLSRTASTLHSLMGGGANPDPEFAARVARRLPENADIVQSLDRLQAVYGYCQQAWSAMRAYDQEAFVGQPDGGSLSVTAENRDMLRQGGNFLLFGDRLHVFGNMEIGALPGRAAGLVNEVLNATGDSPEDMARLFNGRPVETMGAVSPEFIAATAARLPRNVLNGQYQQQLARQAAEEQERTEAAEAVRRQQEEELRRQQEPPQAENNGPQAQENGQPEAEENPPQQENGQLQQGQQQNNGQQDPLQQGDGQAEPEAQAGQRDDQAEPEPVPQARQGGDQTEHGPQQENGQPQQENNGPQAENGQPQDGQNRQEQNEEDARRQRQAVYDELMLGDIQRSVLENETPEVRQAYLDRRRASLQRMEQAGSLEAYRRARVNAGANAGNQPAPAQTEEATQAAAAEPDMSEWNVVTDRDVHTAQVDAARAELARVLTPEQVARRERLKGLELSPELYAEMLMIPQQEWEIRMPRLWNQYQSFGGEKITPENDLSKVHGQEQYERALAERGRAYNEQQQTKLYDEMGLSGAERDAVKNLGPNEKESYQRILSRIRDRLMALGEGRRNPAEFFETYKNLRKIESADSLDDINALENDLAGGNDALDNNSPEADNAPEDHAAGTNDGAGGPEEDDPDHAWRNYINALKSEVHKVLNLPDDLQAELNELSEDDWIKRIVRLERQAAVGRPITKENDLSELEGPEFEKGLEEQRRFREYDELGLNEQERAAMEYLEPESRTAALATAWLQVQQRRGQAAAQAPQPQPVPQPAQQQPTEPAPEPAPQQQPEPAPQQPTEAGPPQPTEPGPQPEPAPQPAQEQRPTEPAPQPARQPKPSVLSEQELNLWRQAVGERIRTRNLNPASQEALGVLFALDPRIMTTAGRQPLYEALGLTETMRADVESVGVGRDQQQIGRTLARAAVAAGVLKLQKRSLRDLEQSEGITPPQANDNAHGTGPKDTKDKDAKKPKAKGPVLS